MKPLALQFIGRGSVRGFEFKQLKASNNGYLYEVNAFGVIHYEVFEIRENIRFGNISYPTGEAFGKWAWTSRCLEKAIMIFTNLNDHLEHEKT
jgi:hypothetical protein